MQIGEIDNTSKLQQAEKLLKDRRMRKIDLQEAIEMSPNILAKLGRNEYFSTDVLKRICALLQCEVEYIMEMIPEDREKEQ